MDETEKSEAREKIVSLVNQDNGLNRYLRSNPYSTHDRFSYGGILTKEVFEECMYYESECAGKAKLDIFEKLSCESGLNTFFIVGYQGCGKTTFINSVIAYHKKETGINSTDHIQIDCDDFGAYGEDQALQKILSKKILQYITKNTLTIENYITFYDINCTCILDCINSSVFYKTYKFFSTFINDKKRADNPDNIHEIEMFFADTTIRDSIYVLLLLSLANDYCRGEDDAKSPVLLFIDNMDYVDDYQQLQDFITAIKALTKDMSQVFPGLILSRNSSNPSNVRFTKKVLIFISMRETTLACLPNSHDKDLDDFVFTFRDITEVYEKCRIVDKRLSFIRNSVSLTKSRKEETELIRQLMRDEYTNRVFVPLYNNNYRRVIDAITSIMVDHPDEFRDYRAIMNSSHKFLRHGARGILFKYILDTFNAPKNRSAKDNCLQKIGVLDLQNRKNNNVSVARIILAYLSSHTEPHCDNANNNITLEKIVNDLEVIFSKNEIISRILQMYSLKDSQWTHLVSFSHLNATPTQVSSMLKAHSYDGLDLKETMVHYSCAGKIYLEYVTTHFEFFTSRIFFDEYPALFCASNITGEKRYKRITTRVIEEVERCCESLCEHNDIIKTKCMYTDKQYEDSFFVAQIKRHSNGRGNNQFHEDRLINSHIGYLDRFRLYLMLGELLGKDEKIETNEFLCKIIKRYVVLLEQKSMLNEHTKKELLPYYKQQILQIERTSYRSLDVPINKEL